MLKDPNISSLFEGNLFFFFISKNSAEFRLHLGPPKLSTTINLLNQPIITRSHNSGLYIKPHNSTQYIYHTSKFTMNIVQTSYHEI